MQGQRITLILPALLLLAMTLGCGRSGIQPASIAGDGLPDGRDAAATWEEPDPLVGPDPEILTLSAIESGCTLKFMQIFPADYNSDGVVSGLDMFRVTKLFGAEAGDEDYDQLVDGNGDGRINGMDVFPLSRNFGMRIDGYIVYSDSESDGNFDSLLTPEPLAYTGHGSESEVDLDTPPGHQHVLLRAVNTHVESESRGDQGYFVDKIKPQWTGDPGIQRLEIIDDDSAMVYFTGATDHHSGIVKYYIHYEALEDGWTGWSNDYKLTYNPQVDGEYADYKFEVTNLRSNTQYRFQVVLRDGNDNLTWPDGYLHDLTGPPVPYPQSALPAGPGALNLVWTLPYTWGGDGEIAWDIACDTVSPIPFDGGTIIRRNVSAEPGVPYRLTGLDQQTKYYVAIMSRNGDEPHNVSTSWEMAVETVDWQAAYLKQLPLKDSLVTADGATHLVGVSSSGIHYLKAVAGGHSETLLGEGVEGWREPRLVLEDPLSPSVFIGQKYIGTKVFRQVSPAEWQPETLLTGDFEYPEFAVKTDGGVAQMYRDNTDWSENYAEFNGVGWDVESLDFVGYNGGAGHLALDSGDEPILVYTNHTFDDLRSAARRDGEWEFATLADDRLDDRSVSGLVIDGEGRIFIACALGSDYEAGPGSMLLGEYVDGAWDLQTVRDGADFGWSPVGLSEAPDGGLALLYRWLDGDDDSYRIELSTGSDGDWQHEHICLTGPRLPQFLKVGYDDSGEPLLTLHNGINDGWINTLRR